VILSIDPGINNCGLAVIDLNKKFKVLETLNVRNTRKFSPEEKEVEAVYGNRVVKVKAIHKAILDLLDEYDIDEVVLEAPFYNALTPVAFSSLLEVIVSIKYCIIIEKELGFTLIEPLVIKKLFANRAQAKKDYMREMLYSRVENKDILMKKDIEELTEHEIDAIAVGFTYYHKN
jgi:Holliday junction resolvasome RuvABC endonuclease subunit